MANAGYDRSRALTALRSGDADLIAFGALFIANPDLPWRLARNAPLNVPDVSTFYGGDEKGLHGLSISGFRNIYRNLSEVA